MEINKKRRKFGRILSHRGKKDRRRILSPLWARLGDIVNGTKRRSFYHIFGRSKRGGGENLLEGFMRPEVDGLMEKTGILTGKGSMEHRTWDLFSQAKASFKSSYKKSSVQLKI